MTTNSRHFVVGKTGHAHRSVSMLLVFPTITWLVFALAGVIGLKLQYSHPVVVRKPDLPITFQRLNVNVIKSGLRSSPGVQPNRPQAIAEPPPVPVPLALPLPTVISQTLEVPFPLFIKDGDSPKHSQANYSPRQVSPDIADDLSVQRLVLGQGEGDQPAPEYPREAKLAHQQGSVIVQMTIGEDGQVTEAKLGAASAWPILNQAALQTVRDHWHFGRGPIRYRDIEFVFELHRR